MSGLFLTGKIKTLLDRLTSTRAAALDSVTETRMARLDTTLSTRQDKATALTQYNQLISDIGDLSAGRVRTVGSGLVEASSLSTGSGWNTRYTDVDVSSLGLSDTGKCLVFFHGSAGGDTNSDRAYIAGSVLAYFVFPQLTSTSNLRLGVRTSVSDIVGMWQIVEYY